MTNLTNTSILNTRTWWSQSSYVKISLLALSLCFGVTTKAEQNYQSDIQKLNTKANRTKDLFVDPNFNFDTYKTLTLDIQVLDISGKPSANKLLRISSIPAIEADNENQDIEKNYVQRSVISLAKTDNFGKVYKQIEVSNLLTSILIELNEKTPNNRILLNVPVSLHVSHTFEIK